MQVVSGCVGYGQWRTEGGGGGGGGGQGGRGGAVAPGRCAQGGVVTGWKKQGGAKTGCTFFLGSVFNQSRNLSMGGRAPIVCLPPGADYPQYATQYLLKYTLHNIVDYSDLHGLMRL